MDNKITVIDNIMGGFKTTWAINNIVLEARGDKFIFVTPYLDEIERIKQSCDKFFVPVHIPSSSYSKGSKSVHLKSMLAKGVSIITTHALFDKMDAECIDLIRTQGYTLYMDEVHEVLGKVSITESDYNILSNTYISVKEDTGQVIWHKEDYTGRFEEFRNLCNLGAVYKYNDTLYVWCFPVEIFAAMTRVYILTYFFEGQVQAAYYKMHNMKYNMKQIQVIDGKPELVDYTVEREKQDIKDKINLISLYQGNLNYENGISLSTRYFKSANAQSISLIKNNTLNYFKNITKGKSDENMWTTLKDYRAKLKGNGYTKGFVPLNARATNKYANKKNLAYLYNRYLNPIDKNFFIKQGIDIDEDRYALSELLQWVFRSAIRRGEDINLYLPAKRMRDLYLAWSGENNS